MDIESLGGLLKSRRTEERVRAVQHMANHIKPLYEELLLVALQDRSPYVAATAAKALGEIADASTLLAMRARFFYLAEDGHKRDPGCHIRANIAYAFGKNQYLAGTEALRIGIRTVQIEPVGGVPFDMGAHLRANCALALAQMLAPDAVRDISLLLFEGDDIFHNKVEMRKAAAQALARTCDPAARIPLSLRLVYPEQETPEVLQECMQALVLLEDPRSLEILSPYLTHADRSLAAYACLMIAQTQLPEAPALISAAAPQFEGAALQAVLLALSAMRLEEARKALFALQESPSLAVRLTLIEVLGEMRDSEAQAVLRSMSAKDPNKQVRNLALGAWKAGE